MHKGAHLGIISDGNVVNKLGCFYYLKFFFLPLVTDCVSNHKCHFFVLFYWRGSSGEGPEFLQPCLWGSLLTPKAMSWTRTSGSHVLLSLRAQAARLDFLIFTGRSIVFVQINKHSPLWWIWYKTNVWKWWLYSLVTGAPRCVTEAARNPTGEPLSRGWTVPGGSYASIRWICYSHNTITKEFNINNAKSNHSSSGKLCKMLKLLYNKRWKVTEIWYDKEMS